MINLMRLVRFGSIISTVMLIAFLLANAVCASAVGAETHEEIVLPPEDDSPAYMGCVTIEVNVPADYSGGISVKLQNQDTEEVIQISLMPPYNCTQWLPEGIYGVNVDIIKSGHFESQYEETVSVSRYEIASMTLSIMQTEIASLQEKQASFIPRTSIAFEDEQLVWNFLMDLTGNAYGAAGLMGNLYAESRLNPTNLQDACEASLGYNDRSYTDAVDFGTYQDFGTDWAGYGLAQWTWPDRKQTLLEFAQQAGASVGSLDLQLHFLAWELEERGLLSELKAVRSVHEASDLVLIRYEAPQDQGEATRKLRRRLCDAFYNKFMGFEYPLTQRIIQIASNGISEESMGGWQWVSQVYTTAGINLDDTCCAYHSSEKYGGNTDWNTIPPGAIVYGYSGSAFGHAGIYIGNGMVCHYNSGVCFTPLEKWIQEYQGYTWGYPGGSPA